MDPQWDDSVPIYRQLRDRVVAMILEGALKEGDPLPSVRSVAAEFRLNPLTVLKGYQQLVDEQLVEKRRGLGMFINSGARELLMRDERQRFLSDQWPSNAKEERSAVACIEARGLRKAFGSTIAVDGIDLNVEEGRILGLIGPNGAGKSTLLNCVLGLIPYQGNLSVIGLDPWRTRNR